MNFQSFKFWCFICLLIFQVDIAIAGSCIKKTSLDIEQKAMVYKESISKYSALYDVDASLVKAVITAESCFRKSAVSHKGAMGLMQLMPAAAKRWNVSDRLDTDQNIRGGTRYLSYLMERFDNNIQLALAGYHAGEGNVDKYNGIPPFKTTRQYIRNVITVYVKLNLSKSKKELDSPVLKEEKNIKKKAEADTVKLKESVEKQIVLLKVKTDLESNFVVNNTSEVTRIEIDSIYKLGTRFNGLGTRYDGIGLRY